MNRKTGPRSSGRINLNDIAERVGVSPITVSRALRSPGKVSEATRLRIQQAVEDMGYVPDLVAASLASRRSRVVAVILPTITQAVFAGSVQGLADVLRANDYQMVVGDSGYSESTEASLIAALLGRRPDAMILVGSEHTDASRKLLRAAAIPVVEIWELPEHPIDSVVGFSNQAAMQAVTRYLVEQGRCRIGFISTATHPRARARLAGFQQALQQAGLPDDLVAMPSSRGDRLDTHSEFGKLLQRCPTIDAIVCADDLIALDVLFACHRQGLAVPGRIAVTGLCDLPIAGRAWPSLTTVRIPAYEIGREAARLILDRLAGRAETGVTLDLGYDIIRRESA